MFSEKIASYTEKLVTVVSCLKGGWVGITCCDRHADGESGIFPFN